MDYNFNEISRLVGIEGQRLEVKRFGSGHINDTFLAVYQTKLGEKKYIHQRVNCEIFPDPYSQLSNIQRVTDHIHQNYGSNQDLWKARHCLSLVLTENKEPYILDSAENVWRTFLYIEDSYSVDRVDHPSLARHAGQAFGRFQRQLQDLDPNTLTEIIPRFHHTPSRVEALHKAIDADVAGRVSSAQPEIELARHHASVAPVLIDLLADGKLPLRVVHNDTKINNVLFDVNTHEPLCVIDLDTVMPGLVHYDFGDMVRTQVSPTFESEPNVDLVHVRMPYFEAMADGYLAEMGDYLTPQELGTLGISGRLITYEIGIRFLTDYLQGDTYFNISHPDENLHRSRTQLRLVEKLLEHEQEMQEYIEAYSSHPMELP